METILSYLDNMFLNLPDTPDTRHAKEELAAMMEDKYNELIGEGKRENEAIGIVISEFGNIEELSEELGLSLTRQVIDEGSAIKISNTEVLSYIQQAKQTTPKIALGVWLCICSPIALMLLAGFQEYTKRISEGVAVSIGLSVLLVMVAVAVAVFVFSGNAMAKFEHLKHENISLERETENRIRIQQEEERNQGVAKLVIGIILCILSVIPIFLITLVEDGARQDFLGSCAVGLLLFIVSIGVYLIITSQTCSECYAVLLQEKEFSKEYKKNSKLIDKIASVYWPLATVVYLAWSFLTMKWGITWIVWPIAGVMFGAIAAFCSIFQQE